MRHRSIYGSPHASLAPRFYVCSSPKTLDPDRAATASQIEFIDLIINHLTERGVMSENALYESPFVDVSPRGPEGIFPEAKVRQIVSVPAEIRKRAAA